MSVDTSALHHRKIQQYMKFSSALHKSLTPILQLLLAEFLFNCAQRNKHNNENISLRPYASSLSRRLSLVLRAFRSNPCSISPRLIPCIFSRCTFRPRWRFSRGLRYLDSPRFFTWFIFARQLRSASFQHRLTYFVLEEEVAEAHPQVVFPP